jgi:hypothetical protein
MCEIANRIKGKRQECPSTELPLEKISTGLPSKGHPLNCHAGPITKTATTLSQSAFVSFWGLSTIRYGTVKPASLRLCSNDSFSRLLPIARFSSFDIYFKSCNISLALYIVMSDVLALGMMMMGVRLGRLFWAACWGVSLAAEVGSRPDVGVALGFPAEKLRSPISILPPPTNDNIITNNACASCTRGKRLYLFFHQARG